MEEKIRNYLIERKQKTGFRFFSLMHLKNIFGQDISEALNSLYRQGEIRKHMGANSPIIEFIGKK